LWTSHKRLFIVNLFRFNMAKKGDDSKLFAFLAVFLAVIGFIIALAVKKNDKYVMIMRSRGLFCLLPG